MSKYGLQLRVNPSQQKKQPTNKPPLPPPKAFGLDDDGGGDDDVEGEISRQAIKNRALKEIEEQQRKALAEDPNVFDYDGCYDEMKQKSVRRKVQDRADTQPKYIHKLIHKAEERKREHDIIYERKLTKERSKEDHLFADKEKFVTGAYKKKLEEQQRWAREQALRDLRDERDDRFFFSSTDLHEVYELKISYSTASLWILYAKKAAILHLGNLILHAAFCVTKKTDVSDFYFNLHKNVAFGGGNKDSMNLDKKAEVTKPEKEVDKKAEQRRPEKEEIQRAADTPEKERLSAYSNSASESSRGKEGHQAETSTSSRSIESSESNPASDRPVSDSSEQEKPSVEKPSDGQPKPDHHKRGQDALAAAKERFMARKKAKEQ
ncbi:DUF2040 domain-containing protein [Citrus sinensis]|uniref:DUF2040 domain-containing protein n=1 Tax=Citrus sinensis TaxID=2711 RepID=A0ACB8IT56_CITSI|nr:DUF2040 domain-containing protein [Citrus sinensis]